MHKLSDLFIIQSKEFFAIKHTYFTYHELNKNI